MNEVQDNLEEYMELYEKIRARTGDDKVAAVMFQEACKDRRAGASWDELKGNSDPATPKQLSFLKKLGVAIPENLSKQQASALLDRVAPQQAGSR